MNTETIKIQGLEIYDVDILSTPKGPIVAEIVTSTGDVIKIGSTTKINAPSMTEKNNLSIFDNQMQHYFFTLLKRAVKKDNDGWCPTATIRASGTLKHGVNFRHELTPDSLPVVIIFRHNKIRKKILKAKRKGIPANYLREKKKVVKKRTSSKRPE